MTVRNRTAAPAPYATPPAERLAYVLYGLALCSSIVYLLLWWLFRRELEQIDVAWLEHRLGGMA